MKKTIIKGGILFSSTDTVNADILVENGKIAQIGQKLEDPEANIIDAAGKYIFPGFIDPHTHLDMDTGTAHTADDFVSATKGAVSGGTTTIIDFATQDKGHSLTEALKNWHGLADNRSSCHYGFHMAITDWNETTRKELKTMKASGVTSFKLYMAYDNLRSNDREIFEILEAVKTYGGLVSMHCENGDLVNALIAEQKRQGRMSPAAHPLSRPDFVEAEAVNRFLAIAEAAESPVYVVHLSTERGLSECLNARRRGQKVFIETCPQYLLLDDSCYELEGFESAKYVFAPPARKPSDEKALWEAVSSGIVDTIGSDHCSFNMKGGKDLGKNDFSKIPNGMPGVETRPILMYTFGVCKNKMTLNQMTAQLSETPAKIFGMYPQKGALKPGSDADIVIWDPEYEGTITQKDQYQNVDYTPYEGVKTKGRAEVVLLNGETVVEKGRVIAENKGQYIPRGICQL